jgi:hypothetical protein
VLQRLANEHIEQHAAHLAHALDSTIACCDCMHSPHDHQWELEDSGLAGFPELKSQRRMRVSASTATLASSTDCSRSPSSSSRAHTAPSHRFVGRAAAPDAAPDVINATPSPLVPPLPSPLQHVSKHRKRKAAPQMRDLRKACSCTALSTYAALMPPSSLPGLPAPANPGRNSCPSTGLPLRLSSDSSRSAAPAKEQAMAPLLPRTSLLTLAEAAASQSAEQRSADAPQQSPGLPVVAPQPGPAGELHTISAAATTSAGVSGLQVQDPAPVPTFVPLHDTPFTRLEGLPMTLHREATSSGFHRPVRVAVHAPAARRGQPGRHGGKPVRELSAKAR